MSQGQAGWHQNDSHQFVEGFHIRSGMGLMRIRLRDPGRVKQETGRHHHYSDQVTAGVTKFHFSDRFTTEIPTGLVLQMREGFKQGHQAEPGRPPDRGSETWNPWDRQKSF